MKVVSPSLAPRTPRLEPSVELQHARVGVGRPRVEARLTGSLLGRENLAVSQFNIRATPLDPLNLLGLSCLTIESHNIDAEISRRQGQLAHAECIRPRLQNTTQRPTHRLCPRQHQGPGARTPDPCVESRALRRDLQGYRLRQKPHRSAPAPEGARQSGSRRRTRHR